MIPTTYMLLMIYCVLNMNNVSWGTREVAPTLSRRKSKSTQARDDLINPTWMESKHIREFKVRKGRQIVNQTWPLEDNIVFNIMVFDVLVKTLRNIM